MLQFFGNVGQDGNGRLLQQGAQMRDIAGRHNAVLDRIEQYAGRQFGRVRHAGDARRRFQQALARGAPRPDKSNGEA
jgi:hypothetical protein